MPSSDMEGDEPRKLGNVVHAISSHDKFLGSEAAGGAWARWAVPLLARRAANQFLF